MPEKLTFPPILTHFEAKKIIAALDAGSERVTVSLDLGLSQSEVLLEHELLELNGVSVDRDALQKIAEDENKCFELVDGEARPISVFSEHTGWARSLNPGDNPWFTSMASLIADLQHEVNRIVAFLMPAMMLLPIASRNK